MILNGAVDMELLEELLAGYVAKSMRGGARPPLFDCLTHLTVYEEWSDTFEENTRVLKYLITHARHLKTLRLLINMVQLDNAFKRIGAQFEELDLEGLNITDATIDALCRTQAASLRRLTLKGCHELTRRGWRVHK